jgi:hypothetical protein
MMDDYFNDYLNFRTETDMTSNNGQMDEKQIDAYYQDYLKRYPWAKGTRSDPAKPDTPLNPNCHDSDTHKDDGSARVESSLDSLVRSRARSAGEPWDDPWTDDSDMVNSPDHYTHNGIEAIDVIEAKLTGEQYEGYLQGSTMKYLLRSNYKGKRNEDLKKAQWYLNTLVENQS